MRKISLRISSCTARKQTTPHLVADSATGLFALWKPHSASSGRRLVSFITHIVICIWINAMEKAKHRWANGCISLQMKRINRPAGSFGACQLAIFRGGFDVYFFPPAFRQVLKNYLSSSLRFCFLYSFPDILTLERKLVL